jgi:hypothetical protein
MKKLTIKKAGIAICLILSIFSISEMKPHTAYAIPVIVIGNTSPTEIMNTATLTMQKVKSFVLDGLAWHVAKLIVQQITASVVNWINTGFKGSPAFLTNPGGFFANVGDQLTGAFIADTGVLSALCSPFSVDLRLALALDQAGSTAANQYKCTLSSVISNVKNSTVNGMSIGGFLNGNFSQGGGWPAFISLTSPQNNESGAYLQAHSDLLEKIGAKQDTVKQQLVQGNGFLSWNSCNDISGDDAASTVYEYGNATAAGSFDNQEFNATIAKAEGDTSSSAMTASYATGGNTSITASMDPKTGEMTYQDCETETPGSVINSQLEKSLGSGVDQLNLANSINEIVDALLAQLVNQVLQNGLSSASTKPSGATQSYIDQLSAETTASSTYASSADTMSSTVHAYVTSAEDVEKVRQQAVDAFESLKSNYAIAQTCFSNLQTSEASGTYNPTTYTGLSDTDTIQTALSNIASNIDQASTSEASYEDSLENAEINLTNIENEADTVSSSNVSDADSLQNASYALQDIVSGQSSLIDGTELSNAQNDLTTAQTLISSMTSPQSYITECQSLGGTI